MTPKLINELKELDIPLNLGFCSNDLNKLEKITVYKFPYDFVKFYNSANGYKEDCSFERQQIWNHKKIISEYLEYSDEFVRFYVEQSLDWTFKKRQQNLSRLWIQERI